MRAPVLESTAAAEREPRLPVGALGSPVSRSRVGVEPDPVGSWSGAAQWSMRGLAAVAPRRRDC